jgi:hypothetical protein
MASSAGFSPPDQSTSLTDALLPLIYAIQSGQVPDLTFDDLRMAIAHCHNNGVDDVTCSNIKKLEIRRSFISVPALATCQLQRATNFAGAMTCGRCSLSSSPPAARG